MERVLPIFGLIAVGLLASCGEGIGFRKSSEFCGETTIIVRVEGNFLESGPSFLGPGKSSKAEYPKIKWSAVAGKLNQMQLSYTAIEPIAVEISETGYESETIVIDSESPKKIEVRLKRDAR